MIVTTKMIRKGDTKAMLETLIILGVILIAMVLKSHDLIVWLYSSVILRGYLEGGEAMSIEKLRRQMIPSYKYQYEASDVKKKAFEDTQKFLEDLHDEEKKRRESIDKGLLTAASEAHIGVDWGKPGGDETVFHHIKVWTYQDLVGRNLDVFEVDSGIYAADSKTGEIFLMRAK